MSNARRTNIGTVDDDGSAPLLTRRAVLAGGSVVALGGLAGCTSLDGLMDRAGEQAVGTTVSAPAAFYAGRISSFGSAGGASQDGSSDGTQVFRTVPADVRRVPATLRADSRSIELEGWSTSGVTKAQGYNSSRSNKPRSEWWAGPDDTDDDSDDDGLVLATIQDVELALLGHVTTAQAAVERRDEAAARGALDAFINATTKALRPALDRCGTGVCETIRENSEIREQGVRRANDAVGDGDWTVAVKELTGVEEIVLGDIARLDDELVDRDPERPRFSDLVEYLRGEPTIGERFTVCLPDAKLPGDRGSLAEELTLDLVLAYFASSKEEGGRHTPFHNKYRPQFSPEYDGDGCLQIDGPISLHEDVACQNILSAKLDTYTTENRAIVGYGTEGGAVVSAAPASSDTIGKRVFLATNDVTGEIILGEDRDMVMPGDNVSNTQTLVCPVTVTPEDCPCPLPGIFYVRRVIHDDQIIFAGGWLLDEGALYEDSATFLFAEGPTEVASVTPEDIESDDYDDRIVAQFARERSQQGSAVGSAQVQGTDMNKAELIEAMASQAFQSDEGRKGLNAVNVKVIGEQGDDEDGDGGPGHVSATALDAPLVHLAGAGELSDQQKRDLIVPVAMDKGLLAEPGDTERSPNNVRGPDFLE